MANATSPTKAAIRVGSDRLTEISVDTKRITNSWEILNILFEVKSRYKRRNGQRNGGIRFTDRFPDNLRDYSKLAGNVPDKN